MGAVAQAEVSRTNPVNRKTVPGLENRETWGTRRRKTVNEPYGPTTLVSLLFNPMITHTTLPEPSGAQEGEPNPVPPPPIRVQPDQLDPLKTSA